MTKHTGRCEPMDGDHEPAAACQATFMIDGQSGNQKYLGGGGVTLQADDTSADSYLWQVTSSPPHCDYILTGSTQPTAKLSMPSSGAYVVQLSVCKGDCVAQDRAILWVATPRRLYRIPADSEALRFDGDEEWAGDLARVVQQVDWNLPTPEQKAALDAAHQPGDENPFATLDDLPGGPVQPCDLTEDEVAAIKAANEPGAENPFATLSDLPEGGAQPCQLTETEIDAIKAAEEPGGENPFVTDTQRRRFAPTADQKAALDGADEPHSDNPFVTTAHLGRVAPTAEQKQALDAADDPNQHNPYVTESHLQDHVPTSEQRQALDRAEDPRGENPFVTESRLEQDILTADQRAAIRRARAPTWENPFVTDSHLRESSPTTEQRAALNNARCPTGENPFVTESHLEEFAPTPEQRAALDSAQDPDATNPFVTHSALPPIREPQLTEDQVQAIQKADDPGEDNPFITKSALPEIPEPQLTVEQEAAIDAADTPSGDNPFVTWSALPPDELTGNQKAAINAGQEPSGDNPFVTESALPVIPKPPLTAEQEAAIDAADTPGGDNPFVTKSALPPDELTGAQKAALDAAHDPGAENPFVTESALPVIPGPQLTAEQEAAIDGAADPSDTNPFVTRSELPLGLTTNQKAALDAAHGPSAANPVATLNDLGTGPSYELSDSELAAIHQAQDPGATNPFITHSALPPIPKPQLTADQEQAIDAAQNPSTTNPFITHSALPPIPKPQLTADQEAAIDAAQSPSGMNPFATMADLGQAGVVTRTVAAGTLDLSVLLSAPGNGLGGLAVVDILAERGVATVHFEGYQLSRKSNYVVKVLPIRADAKTVSAPPADPLGFRQFIVVQLVEFTERGFELQMIQPLHQVSGVPALGPCMIEVSEILAEMPKPEPETVTLEQAVKRYYNLIQQGNYAQAWPMLSERFRTDRGLTLERYVGGWERSGPAILVGLRRCEMDGSRATLVLDLDFPSEGPAQERKTHLIRYGFVHDEVEGHPGFGHWLFVAGKEIELEDEVSEIWERLTGAERDRLGQVKEPCTPEISAKFTLQRFERGLMYWFEHPGFTDNIWVLYEPEADYMRGASWRRYVDDWPKEEEYSCDEARANGPNGPVRGFGWLWCRDADVRQRLGNPLEPEAGSGDEPPFSRAVFFEGGVIFFKPKRQDPLNTADQCIILFDGGGWRRLNLP